MFPILLLSRILQGLYLSKINVICFDIWETLLNISDTCIIFKDRCNLFWAEMPTFKNKMRLKCELSFAEWVNQPDVRTSKMGRVSKALKA